ncbi:MAG: sensor protein [Chloroflexi bacterium OLB15]|nr:MAG: sensor protein [Chloroflexi bacterium OLB15]
MRLRLGAKFTLILSLVFICGILASWVAFSSLLQEHAEREMTARASALIETMNSVRHYTTTQINPLLQDELAASPEFISETVPAYSAREVFEQLRTHPEYAEFFYKEASDNPTNPRDLADSFEGALLAQFREQPDQTLLSGFTQRGGVEVYYNARPLRVSAESCLSCHSSPETAPESLLTTYGLDSGFGWNVGDTIAAQIIYVPAAEVIGNAQSWVTLTMVVVIVIFAVVLLLMNFLLRRMVIKPIEKIATTARKISEDVNWTPDAADVVTVGKMAERSDEIGETAQVFAKMTREVYDREQKLKQEVRRLEIQIDHAKREREVKQITETDYFQQLQSKAKNMRDQQETKSLQEGDLRPNEG